MRAADIVIAALRECGLDPVKAALVPVVGDVCREWAQGRITDEEFKRSCATILVLNPGLALGGAK